MDLKHSGLTELILKSFFNVYNELGYGFLEKVYENALIIELKENGLICDNQKRIEVFYKGNNVGDYSADIIVNDCVVVELKTAESISEAHGFQLLNYLKATKIEVGLLLNFGKKPEFKRKIYTNDNK